MASTSPSAHETIKSPARGFTLIELMVTISIAAILALIALPSMRSLIERNALAGQVNGFIGAITLARTEAIKRNATTVLCRSTNAETGSPPTCSNGTDWKSGWMVFLDRNDNGSFDTENGDVLLRVQGGFPKSKSITQNTSTSGKLVFRRTGLMQTGTSSFEFESVSGSLLRCVRIGKSGRARFTDAGC